VRHVLALVLLLPTTAAGAGPPPSNVERVVTVAGGGLGDGGPATSACLGLLGAIAVDRAGNVYLTDINHKVIRRFEPGTGTLATVAGTGRDPKGAESGPALSVPIATASIAFDPDGNLVFTQRNVVRQLDPASSSIRTIAGNGGTVWHGGVIAEGGPARTTPLGLLTGVAVSQSGEVFLGDPDRSQVLRIDREGRLTAYARLLANLIASKGEACSSVFDVAVAPSGEVYFDDQCHSMIFRISSGVPIHVAGINRRNPPSQGGVGGRANWRQGEGGPARDATLDVPMQLAFDGLGNLYFGEGHGTLRKVDRGGRISTVWGPDLSRYPVSGVAVTRDGDVVFACDEKVDIGRLYRWSSREGTVTLLAGSGLKHCCGDGAPGPSAVLYGPVGVAVTPNSDVIIADHGNHRVRRLDARTSKIATIAGGGEYELPGAYHNPWRVRPPVPPGRIPATKFEVPDPVSVAVDRDGNVLFALSHGPIFRIDASDGALTTVGKPKPDQKGNYAFAYFDGIGGIACGPRGETVIAAMNRIWRIAPDGQVGAVAGTDRSGFFGDGGPARLADLSNPSWPVVDGVGRIFFVDTFNHRIRMIAEGGTISTVAGNGEEWVSGPGDALREAVGSPSGLTVAADGEGLLYVCATAIWRLDPKARTLSIVAGGEGPNYPPPPDGPLAAGRSIGRPRALACGARGVIYFSEPDYDRVRAIVPSG
jgi:sugar lactone lactonase YvrE